MGAINPSLSDKRKVTYTKYALVALTVEMILLGLMRSENMGGQKQMNIGLYLAVFIPHQNWQA
ncbi:hypothetical protein [Desulfosporosinus orientis]|uniref:hypothetical protein n=1 Tax=Desulfosporosinus orientis TaxID=1563 RepID=UPI0005A73823